MICPKCKEVVAAGSGTKCGKCKRQHHRLCMTKVKSNMCSKKYMCDTCISGMTPGKKGKRGAEAGDPGGDSEVRKQPERAREPAPPPRPGYTESREKPFVRPVGTPEGEVSRKIEEIMAQICKLSSQMNDLQEENCKLKKDNNRLRTMVDQMCVLPCKPKCEAKCGKEKKAHECEQPPSQSVCQVKSACQETKHKSDCPCAKPKKKTVTEKCKCDRHTEIPRREICECIRINYTDIKYDEVVNEDVN